MPSPIPDVNQIFNAALANGAVLANTATLDELIAELSTPFDVNDAAHVASLRRLWELAWPKALVWPKALAVRPAGPPFEGVVSARWPKLGFQQSDPTSDLRGAGVSGVRHLIAFFVNHPDVARAACEDTTDVVLAMASLNVTLLLRAYLRLHRSGEALQPVAPGGNLVGSDEVRRHFAAWASEEGGSTAFETLHGAFLCHLLRRWDVMRARAGATRMNFPLALAGTRDLIGFRLPWLPTPWYGRRARRVLERAAWYSEVWDEMPTWLLGLGEAAGEVGRKLILCDWCESRGGGHARRRVKMTDPEGPPEDAPLLGKAHED